MIFNSFEFILFFPIMVLGYYSIPFRFRWLWLLLGSYYFYMAHEPELVILLLISTVVDYSCGLQMARVEKPARKKYLITSILVNIGILFTFKYLGFFTGSIEQLLSFFGVELAERENYGSFTYEQIILPVGISFYTFQTLSYTIDVYREKIKPERHFGKFALFVAFFPQLVAGPIERAGRLLPQLKKHTQLNTANLRQGLVMMAWGFFLKVVVADRLGLYVDLAFSDPELYHGLPLVIAMFFFAGQLYYDFSGYTAIAIGAAKIFGVNLMQNFNRPFFATSVSQFWQRWHISFILWIRDYLYVPLGGSKVSMLFTLRNVILVFIVVGLWHGANWTFVIWGVLNALLLILEVGTKNPRKWLFRKLGLSKRTIALGGWAFVMGYMAISLIFFRSPSINEALLYIQQMFNITNLHVNILDSYFELAVCFSFILLIQSIHYFKGNDKIYELIPKNSTVLRWSLYLGYLLTFVLFAINRQNAFIYFQF